MVAVTAFHIQLSEFSCVYCNKKYCTSQEIFLGKGNENYTVDVLLLKEAKRQL